MLSFSVKNSIKALTILELPDNIEITQEMIKTNYRKLCLIYHPDQANARYKNGDKFCQIQEARDYLSQYLAEVNLLIINGFQEKTSYSSAEDVRRRKEEDHRREENIRRREEEVHRREEENRRREENNRRREEENRRREEARRQQQEEQERRAEAARKEAEYRRAKEAREQEIRRNAEEKEKIRREEEETRYKAEAFKKAKMLKRNEEKIARKKARRTFFIILLTFAVIIFVLLVFSNTKSTPTEIQLTPVYQSNGFINAPAENGTVPLKINAPNSGPFYVSITPNGIKKECFSVFLNKGSSLVVNIPGGKYDVYYCTGDTWYGPRYLFGKDTVYFKLKETLQLDDDTSIIAGKEIDLYVVLNGNFDPDRIDYKDFPYIPPV